MSRKMSRRDFMRLLTAGTGGIVLASCTPSTPETITVVETKEVIKEVTATPPSVVQEELADVLGTFPRRETLIADILTGRCGSPDNFNEWVGWKNRDRGMQTLA
ncbi:MAG TPA: twin-arginine translocation signal domain-containing protein, partial [Aggregatilineaceae bacterium]|nr:twin-arginine translocation signal domain-containing protein [Aggregatilineaceae bacterium]